jgi:hypothetical protein
MAIMITYLRMPYNKKNAINWERRKRIDHLCLMTIAAIKIYSRHKYIFIYINITKNYQHKLIEDTRSHVNHDGDWRRINKDLTMMNHASEKSKRGSWCWGTRYDREGQVDVWLWGINQAMESHIALSVDIYWIKKSRCYGQKRSLDYIR